MFAWLAKIFNWPSKADLDGICLQKSTFWEVSPPRDAAAFARNLPELLPEGSIICIEGTSIAADVVQFLETRQAATSTKVARGTIWPRPRVFHLPATPENVAVLASLFDAHAAPEICDHFHVYLKDKVYLEWHDAFLDDPLLLSTDLPENVVGEFALALGSDPKLAVN